MRGGIAKMSDGTRWSKLNQVRKQVLQQLMPYICNTTLLLSRDVLPVDQIIHDLRYAKHPKDIRDLVRRLTDYNESGTWLDITEAGFNTGSAYPQHPFDDSMDKTD